MALTLELLQSQLGVVEKSLRTDAADADHDLALHEALAVSG